MKWDLNEIVIGGCVALLFALMIGVTILAFNGISSDLERPASTPRDLCATECRRGCEPMEVCYNLVNRAKYE